MWVVVIAVIGKLMPTRTNRIREKLFSLSLILSLLLHRQHDIHDFLSDFVGSQFGFRLRIDADDWFGV